MDAGIEGLRASVSPSILLVHHGSLMTWGQGPVGFQIYFLMLTKAMDHQYLVLVKTMQR